MELLASTPASFALLSGCLLFVILAWKRISTALWVIALLLPSYLIRFTVAGLPATFLEYMIVLLFAVWLIRGAKWRHLNLNLWKKKEVTNKMPSAFRAPLALLLISAALAAVLSPAQPASFGILKAYFIEPLLLLIVMTYEIRTREQLDHIMAALGVTTMLIGCIALYQYISGAGITNPFWADPAHRRITTFFGYPNANSLFVAPIIAYYLASFQKDLSFRKKIFYTAVILLGLATIVTAKTAGALLALGSIVWILLYRSSKLRGALIALTLIGCIVLVSMAPVRERIMLQLTNISKNHLDLKSSSLEIRINQWRETAQLLYDHPWVGGGLANYQAAVRPYHTYGFLEIYLYPHNMFLNAWSELGLLGLVAFVWLLGALGISLKRTLSANMLSGDSRALAWGLTAAWTVIVIHGLVDVPYFKNDLSVLWMIFTGATIYLVTATEALTERHTKTW